MSISSNKAKSEVEPFQWVSMSNELVEQSPAGDMKSKKFCGVLLPIGCLVTGAVLGRGIFSFLKKGPLNQQFYMRLRVISQTASVVLIACFLVTCKKNK